MHSSLTCLSRNSAAVRRGTYVNIGPQGTFKKSGQVVTTPEDIDAIFSYLQNSGKQKLVIHLHGGLVSEAHGMEIAQSMRKVYEDANCHPVPFARFSAHKMPIAWCCRLPAAPLQTVSEASRRRTADSTMTPKLGRA